MGYKVFNTRHMMDPLDTYTLRGICMLMIIVHHVFKMYPDCPGTVMRWGFLGTGLFFFVSGWGLYCSMNKRTEVDWVYFVTQIKKLLIPYLVIWPITELMYCVRYSEYFSMLSVCRDFFTLTFPPFPALWFMKVIVATYILTIITFIAMRNKLIRLIVVTIFCFAYYWMAWKVWQLPTWWFGNVPCFVVGMWLAAYKENLKWILDKKYLLLILSVFGYYLFFRHNPFPIPTRTFLCVAFSFGMVSLVSVYNVINSACDYIGRNSLLFYLWHVSLCELIIPPPEGMLRSRWASLIIILTVTIVLCVLYNHIEKLLQHESSDIDIAGR